MMILVTYFDLFYNFIFLLFIIIYILFFLIYFINLTLVTVKQCQYMAVALSYEFAIYSSTSK